MSGIVLLIIGLASLGLVLGMLVWLAFAAWRLVKHGIRVSSRVAPMAAELAGRAGEAERLAERLATNGEAIEAHLASLQVSLARLQILASALEQAARPCWRVGSYLGLARWAPR